MSEERLWVLLVDDEASLRMPLAKYLRDTYGYQVDTAADGEETWECVLRAEQPYDVALIDDMLIPKPGAEPEPLGIGLMARIRERCPETECIIFTGWGMDRALEALQAGAYRYLAKPPNLDELGMTIRMAAKQARLRRERDLLAATLEISNAMVRGLDAEKTLKVIAEAVPKLVEAEACAVARVDPATGQVRHEPMILMGDVSVRWQRHLKRVSLTRQIIQTGEAFMLSAVDAHADEVDENIRRAGVKSFVGVPISGEAQNQGVLYAYSTRREAFGTHEQRVLQLLAGQAAIALENARLFEAEARRRQEAETLRETALALTTSLDQQEVFERILSELQKVVPYDSASVQVCKGNWLEIIGGRGFPTLPEIVGLSFPVDGDNPNREVFRRRDYFIVPDAPAVYEDFLKEPHVQADIHSWLGVPMLIGDRLIGMIALDSHQPGFYTEEHGRLARSFAAQAALAIENARLFAEVNRRARNLETLQNLALTINSSLHLNETLEAICRAAVEFLNADHSGLVLFAPDYVEGKVRAEYPASGTLGTTIPLRRVPAEERLIETQEPLVIHDVAGDETLGEVRDILLRFGIQSILIVPVMSKDRGVLGSFSLDAVGHVRQFTQEEVELCRVFAAHVAVAVENARLFESTREGRAYIQSLFEASSAIISPTEPNQVLQAIVDTACKTTGAWRAVALLMDEGEQPRILAQVGFEDHLEPATATRPTGLSRQVIRSKAPRFLPDTQAAASEVHPRMLEQGTKAAACLPLLLQDKAIGVLWIQFKETRPFSEAEKQALQVYASQAAIAYDHARRMRELEHLRLAAEKLASVAGVREVLQQIVASARGVLEADSSVIWSYDDIRHVFFLDELVADGIELALLERFRSDEPSPGGTAETVMERGYIGITDMDDPKYDFLGPTARGLRGAIGVKSFQGISLRVGEERLGVLYVNYACPRSFSDEDRATLETFAYHAALALKRARLLEQIERTKQAAGVVAGVTVQEDLQTTLNTIVQHVQQVLQCDAVSLYSYDETKGQLGPWVVDIIEPRARDSAGPPDKLSTESAVWTILRLGGPQYHHLAEDGARDDPLFRGKFAHKEGIEAAFGIQLRAGERNVGVMFVNYRSRHRFPADEIAAIELFANQAAVAIRNAQLYEETNRRASALQALYAAGQAVTSTLTLRETLDCIAHQSLVLVGGKQEEGCFNHLALKTGNWLRFTAASTPEILAGLQEKVGDIDLEKSPKIGITGRVAKTEQAENVGDVTKDQDYICFEPRTRSELAVPIKLGQWVIGVINVEHPKYHAFRDEDLRALENLAAQAAIAIQNARLYEQAQMVARISQEAARRLELSAFLETLFAQLKGVFQERRIPVSLSLATFDKDANSLILHPTAFYPEKARLDVISLDDKGIMPWVAKTRELYYTPDVSQDSHYLPLLPDTRSEIAVPISFGEELLGVLDLESPVRDAFTPEDQQLLQTLADQIATTIQNVRQYEELKHTKGLVGARTALAWMGMVSSEWKHRIRNQAQTIQEQVQLLCRDLQLALKHEHYASINDRLSMIERLAMQIQEKPIILPLSTEEGVVLFAVNDLIGERAKQLWRNDPYREVELCLDLRLDNAATVRASPEWLRRAFEILVDNAVEAVTGRESRRIIITTQSADGGAKIAISDTGPGIPPKVFSRLFEKQIEKPEGAKGFGIGLLIAQCIVETYGGNIGVESTGPMGTTMVIWLPLAK